MAVGLSNCVVREGDSSMCKADDKINRATYPDQDWSATFSFDATSRCSRAKRQVSKRALLPLEEPRCLKKSPGKEPY
jgi:hypothetical protein